jgi:glycosyltransferase involved in cell wall biosynthesis
MISVITPVYNGIDYIESCIQNVIDQGCSDVEHIIVDGASTDGTTEVIEKYAKKYKHIRWVSEIDRGQSDAMNIGIALAKGQFISFLNFDDYYEEQALNRAHEILSVSDEPSLIVGNCNLINVGGKIIGLNKPKHLKITDLLMGYKVNPFPVNPSAYFYHKSLHEIIGVFDIQEHNSMDLDFMLKAVQKANVKYFDELWGNHRRYLGTKTVQNINDGSLKKMVDNLMDKHLENIPIWKRAYVRLGRLAAGKSCYRRFLYHLIYPQKIPSMAWHKLASIYKQLMRAKQAKDTQVKLWAPPGAFNSPISNHKDSQYAASRMDNEIQDKHIDGISLNESKQLDLLHHFSKYYADIPFSEKQSGCNRYFYNNLFFSYTDANILYSFIRHFNSKRIFEIGGGFSSAAMLDINELVFANKMQLTLVEPRPQRLHRLLKPIDFKNNSILIEDIRDVDSDVFKALGENDILFVDSAHVVKPGGALNHILFNILPILSPGVLIHFHDIVWPFDYPHRWLENNRCYNEAYLIRAFMINNKKYSIEFFNSYMTYFYKDYFQKHLPSCLKTLGSSLWLRKTS